MSIADDIKKVMRVHSFECLSDSEIAELAGDLAPRLAHFAQQVMPLVEAAERYKKALAKEFDYTERRLGQPAIDTAAENRRKAASRLIDAAYKMEVPT